MIRIALGMLLAIAALPFSAAASTLETGWDSPPNDAKVRAYWWWLNGNVDKEAITRDLVAMKDKGFGGALLCDAGGAEQRNNKAVPAGPKFGSPEWTGLYLHTLREADRLGLEISLSIQSGWNLGGPDVTPGDTVKKFVWSEIEIGADAQGPTALPEPGGVNDGYYREVCVLAYPVIRKPSGGVKNWDLKAMRSALKFNDWFQINSAPPTGALFEEDPSRPEEQDANADDVLDLSDKLGGDGTLDWRPESGRWKVIRLGYTLGDHRHVSTCSDTWKGYAIDPLDAGAFNRYWEVNVKPLLEAAGPLAGKTLKYVHTDSWEVDVFNWTPAMREEFRKRRGYGMTPWMPALTGRIVDSREATGRFLFDYRKTLGELVIDHHYALMKQYAGQYGVGMHPESGGPHYTPIDAQRCLGMSDVPMSEFWADNGHRRTDNVKFFVKQPASAAHTYGHRFVAAEGFTTIYPQWQERLWDNLKPAFDHACLEGLNRLVWHAFVCSPASQGVPGQQYFAGTHLNPLVTWWPQSGAFFDYLNRCQYMLQQGLFVADACYYYGDHVPNYTQLRVSDPARLGAGYDYDVITEDAILTRLSAKDGRLVLPDGMSYRIMVIPSRTEISLPVLRKLKEFSDAGVTIVGPKSKTASGLAGATDADAEVQALAEAIWGAGGRGVEHNTGGGVLAVMGIVPDFSFTPISGKPDVNYIHRRTDGAEIYFVAHRGKEPASIRATFRVSGMAPEIWDAVTGERRFATDYEVADAVSLPLSFGPCGSAFVVFREDAAAHPATGAPNFPVREDRLTLAGPWTVHFDPAMGAPESVVFPALENWINRPEEAVKYYSGKATYELDFELPAALEGKPLDLDLGNVCELADVRLNGKSLGVVWSCPFRLDVSGAIQSGANHLEIDVVNFWANRIIGDKKLPEAQRHTKTNITSFQNGDALMPSGLLGPARLVERVR